MTSGQHDKRLAAWLVLARWNFRAVQRSRERPVGLAHCPESLPPIMMESQRQGLLPARLFSITLTYGEIAEMSRPVVRVTTWWPFDRSGESPLQYELGKAEKRDRDTRRGAREIADIPPIQPPAGRFTEQDAEVIAGDDRVQIKTISWKHYSSSRFRWAGCTALVVTRHQPIAALNFGIVSDLTPFFEGVVRYIQSGQRSSANDH